MPKRILSLIATATLMASPLVVIPASAHAHTTGIHDNCTKFNKRYPHGVGTRNARDRGAADPVTNFKRADRIYWEAERHNGSLDRDNDRVACEKH
jgi:Excalibur calcium-binding domain